MCPLRGQSLESRLAAQPGVGRAYEQPALVVNRTSMGTLVRPYVGDHGLARKEPPSRALGERVSLAQTSAEHPRYWRDLPGPIWWLGRALECLSQQDLHVVDDGDISRVCSPAAYHSLLPCCFVDFNSLLISPETFCLKHPLLKETSFRRASDLF